MGLEVRAVIVGGMLAACQQSEARGRLGAIATATDAPAVAASAMATSEPSTSAAPVQPPSPFRSGGYRQVSWQLEGPFGSQPVVAAVPISANEQQRLPVLVVFHGRGESLKSPPRGARGFIDDYGLLRALQRLEEPPLSVSDFGGWISSDRLQLINDSLAQRPYRGLIVVCPYLPDILRAEAVFSEGRALAEFVVSAVLPKVYAETPALPGAAHTAADGVSLGGRAALAMAMFTPRAFSAAAATQPAVDLKEIARMAELLTSARRNNPQLQLRLLTSDDDYFLGTTRELSQALHEQHVIHRFEQVRGNHSYEFNRGPGVYEMLLFADRALRRD